MMQKQEQGTMESMQMTFFWGEDVEVWFSGWPAGRLAMYLLSLALVFVFSPLYEWLSVCKFLARPGAPGAASGLLQTLLHGLRVGVAYLVMLSIMTFNVGILLVAIAGHAVGFLLFGSGVFSRRHKDGDKHQNGLPTNP
ncbi:Copper transporter 1 [Nymphaea thermarum]|nr:Copper transporter 1 [Nymphaea thermarum]